MWLKSLILGSLLQIGIAGAANAAGPFGSVNVGNWIGGAFSNDQTGAFSHCAATTPYLNGVILVVGYNAVGTWSLAFASPSYRFKQGENAAIDVIFDGQEQARLFATANQPNMLTAVMPANVVRTFQKASLMVATSGRTVLNFDLTSTGPVIAALANCVSKVKADGLDKAGDFTKGAAKPAATAEKQPSPPAGSKVARAKTGTGFVVSANGHIVTNHHVIDGCVGDIKGNLTGEVSMVLRVVSSDASNDLALLQAPSTTTFKDFARIRDRSIRSGDSVIVIGFPFHGLLSSDFTVTTGIASSLSGMRNDTRFLQISAPVQPGNSGGPLFDTTGQIVGVVTAKIPALRIAAATGNIPENINFAIKTGALRDFLDNSVVPYQTAEPKGELKTTDIAGNARPYTMLISCNATEQAEAKR
ncbi:MULTISPECIES: S1C family serine protease [Bradyrhizobium]|uniref:S1C family serine protease n=1 Tax=Bradyrhizobium TaxID=374 RepID=UPI000489531F|nr:MULTISPECIES: serine protease [Bradyrhizobium]MBR1288796.1 trypsin-like peptidase domain-containing protein [Bradyrhizobium ottawaense]MBR1326844.1 trypsin-like peptidase domain-containing protein [Bradyrhizobium ottawaense]MBR1332491.1 trypsin-like peptidase domain-containing protein [Bradyrhizobium ottawaense]MBR1362263.1 trypsin-like peptidase domain-containing protein [Bradyrhizobium ottawaense]MDA9417037.1 serine protease [Bradyrhizobium sp. CCBAU 25360]